MLSRFLVAHRWKKIQAVVANKSYEIRPRVMATQLALLVNPNWVTKFYSMAEGQNITLNIKHRDPVKLIGDLEKLVDTVRNRQESLSQFLVGDTGRTITMHDWLVDKNNRIVSAFLVTKELQRLTIELSNEIESCYLSREDLFDYYQRMTVGHMEDVTEFLEAVLSLKLRK